MTILPVAQAVSELRHTKSECLAILIGMDRFFPVPSGTPYPPEFRLLAVPMLYSAWERCFTFCHAIGLRVVRDEARMPIRLPPAQRTTWLIRTDFFQSFVAKNYMERETPKDRVKKGKFATLSEFVSSLETWTEAPFDRTASCSEFVMTFSNVNPDVVQLNAEALGIWQFSRFQKIKFGRLHSLVALRNGIGHGGTLVPPADEEFRDLWGFTEALIGEYCDTFEEWMLLRFGVPRRRIGSNRFRRLPEMLQLSRKERRKGAS